MIATYFQTLIKLRLESGSFPLWCQNAPLGRRGALNNEIYLGFVPAAACFHPMDIAAIVAPHQEGEMMKALVLGTGAREHALSWKLAQSLGKKNTWLHPGNAGTQQDGFANLDSIDPTDAEAVYQACSSNEISLVVIGPEVYLETGLADKLRKHGLAVVGPNKQGARLETSKGFCKDFLIRAGVPTGKSSLVNSADSLRAGLPGSWPVVLKLDGLAAGKGVVIAQSIADVEHFVDRVWNKHEFGKGPHQVLIEEHLSGVEVSYIGLCDGDTFVALETATDHKRVGDGDTGPNTGGMGCVSPSPFFNPTLSEKIQSQVIQPVLNQLKTEKLEFRGVLFFGLMVSDDGTPFVLEINTRFGDPETQAILLRLESDFAALLKRTADGELSKLDALKWTSQASVYIVGAAANYPSSPRKGDVITGVEQASKLAQVFYAGVNQAGGQLVTSGGRVLGVGTLGDNAKLASIQAYSAMEQIRWDGIHYRHDIGLKENN